VPSPIGHCLAGLCAAAAAPRRSGEPGFRSTLAWSVLLANFPDADIALGLFTGEIGAFHRTASHSVLATVAVGVATWAWIRLRGGGRAVSWGIWSGCVFGSHLLLDILVRDPSAPYGIQLFWPFSDSFFMSPFTPFRRFDYADPGRGLLETVFSAGNLLTVGIEILLLAPCVAGLWLLRSAREPRRSA
jgi:inner membrane protein